MVVLLLVLDDDDGLLLLDDDDDDDGEPEVVEPLGCDEDVISLLAFSDSLMMLNSFYWRK